MRLLFYLAFVSFGLWVFLKLDRKKRGEVIRFLSFAFFLTIIAGYIRKFWKELHE